MQLNNPVKDYYSDYVFNPSLPVITFNSYEELLTASKTITKSSILYNKNPQTSTAKSLTIDLSYAVGVEVVLILNVEFLGFCQVTLSGKNYSVSNLSLKNGNASISSSNFIVNVSAPDVSLINFSMIDFKVKDLDKDYIRIAGSGKNFKLLNSLLDGKTNVGVFLRADFPDHHLYKNCVFKNFIRASSGNGGEMIRLATSNFENSKAYATIDSCYFSKCNGDPEVVSVKCSSNTIKNCIFENNTGRLVLRHAHDCVIEHNYFGQSGIRAYGTNHKMLNNQLVSANILLDNKTGSSYVVAKDILVDGVWYIDSPTPVTNKGINCTVKNVKEGLVITKESLLSAGSSVPTGPTGPPSPTGPVPSVTGSTGPNALDFKFFTKNRVIDSSKPVSILKDEDYTVEYISKTTPNTFNLYGPLNTLVKQQVEKNSPYFLYGDKNGVPNYGKLSVLGRYKLVITESAEQVYFDVVASLPL